MVIPNVSRGKIAEALKTFDRKHRNTPEFTGWEHKGTQRYAIVESGRLYPPKMIISLATGMLRSKFSGGEQSNSYLSRRGFRIIDLWKDNVRAALTASAAEKAMEKPDQESNSWKEPGELPAVNKSAISLTHKQKQIFKLAGCPPQQPVSYLYPICYGSLIARVMGYGC